VGAAAGPALLPNETLNLQRSALLVCCASLASLIVPSHSLAQPECEESGTCFALPVAVPVICGWCLGMVWSWIVWCHQTQSQCQVSSSSNYQIKPQHVSSLSRREQFCCLARAMQATVQQCKRQQCTAAVQCMAAASSAVVLLH
jgi:hypothetical protein